MFRCFGSSEKRGDCRTQEHFNIASQFELDLFLLVKRFIKYGTSWSDMDVRTTSFSGRMFLAGGLVALSFSVYSTLVFSIFSITEVIASLLVVIWGVCLLIRSKKMEDSYSETDCDDQSGRISPFYYELEPVAYKRALPPIPRDIGREYDPVILDKV